MALTAEEMAGRALDAKEAAVYLKISEKTMLRLLRAGDIPAAKVGRQWRISRQALESFLAGENAHADAGEGKPKKKRQKKS